MAGVLRKRYLQQRMRQEVREEARLVRDGRRERGQHEVRLQQHSRTHDKWPTRTKSKFN